MEDTRVAVISMIISSEESAAAINSLLHEFRGYIIGRMGIPYRQKGLNIINVVLDAPQRRCIPGRIFRRKETKHDDLKET